MCIRDRDNPIARYYMATVFTYQGRYTEAMEQYVLGLESDPSNPDLHIGLASVSYTHLVQRPSELLMKTFGGSQIYHGIRPLFDEE